MTLTGSLAVSRSWVRAGLAAPGCRAWHRDEGSLAAIGGDLADVETLLDNLTGDLSRESGGSVSALHGMFAELLPTMPPEPRRKLVRLAVARLPQAFAEQGCAWLLDANVALRTGAVVGLSDRLSAGPLSAQVLAA